MNKFFFKPSRQTSKLRTILNNFEIIFVQKTISNLIVWQTLTYLVHSECPKFIFELQKYNSGNIRGIHGRYPLVGIFRKNKGGIWKTFCGLKIPIEKKTSFWRKNPEKFSASRKHGGVSLMNSLIIWTSVKKSILTIWFKNKNFEKFEI